MHGKLEYLLIMPVLLNMFVPQVHLATDYFQVGREQQMAFCLMQKYVELDYLETKLQIISAFALEHVKGHVFLEADKLSDVMEVLLFLKLRIF